MNEEDPDDMIELWTEYNGSPDRLWWLYLPGESPKDMIYSEVEETANLMNHWSSWTDNPGPNPCGMPTKEWMDAYQMDPLPEGFWDRLIEDLANAEGQA